MRTCLLIVCLASAIVGCGRSKPTPKQMAAANEKYWLTLDYVVLHGDKLVDKLLPKLSKDRVTTLKIISADLSDEEMAMIGALASVEFLDLQDCEMPDGALRHLAPLAKLKHLEIVKPSITDADLADIAELRNLNTLRLATGYEGFTDAGLAHLAALHHLEDLELHSKRLTGSGFEALVGHTPLVRLCTSADDAGMEQISRFKQLRYLAIANNVTDKGLTYLASNYWLLEVDPSRHMTNEALLAFRKALLEGRSQAREAGIAVPSTDSLRIGGTLNPEIRGTIEPEEEFETWKRRNE